MANKAIITWINQKLTNYPEAQVKDVTKSWKNGRSFCALVHACGGSIDYPNLKFDTPEEQLKNMTEAFTIAQNELKIPALLDAEDILELQDQKSIYTYLTEYHKVFSGTTQNMKVVGGLQGRPLSQQIQPPQTPQATQTKPTTTPVSPQPTLSFSQALREQKSGNTVVQSPVASKPTNSPKAVLATPRSVVNVVQTNTSTGPVDFQIVDAKNPLHSINSNEGDVVLISGKKTENAALIDDDEVPEEDQHCCASCTIF